MTLAENCTTPPATGETELPPLPEPWQGFQYNSGWKSWEQVVRSSINDPHVTPAYTAEQYQQGQRDAIAHYLRKQAGQVEAPSEVEKLKILALCGVDDLERVHTALGLGSDEPIDADVMIRIIADLRAPSSAPTAGSIGNDEDFWALAAAWASSRGTIRDHLAKSALIAYIDTWAGRSAGAPDLAASFNAAVDAEFPIPDSPHTSVLMRNTEQRAAMWRGIMAAQKILGGRSAGERERELCAKMGAMQAQIDQLTAERSAAKDS